MPSRDRNAVQPRAKLELASIHSAEEARRILDSALTSDPESGVLQLSGHRCVIVRPEVIVNIQKQLEATIGGSAKGVMYLSGERSSKIGFSPADPASGRPLTLKNAQRVIDSTALMGWGRVEIARFDVEASHFALTVQNNPIAAAYGSSTKPVCHFIAGWAAGVARTILGRELLCEETACLAQGSDRCEFELRPMPSQ